MVSISYDYTNDKYVRRPEDFTKDDDTNSGNLIKILNSFLFYGIWGEDYGLENKSSEFVDYVKQKYDEDTLADMFIKSNIINNSDLMTAFTMFLEILYNKDKDYVLNFLFNLQEKDYKNFPIYMKILYEHMMMYNPEKAVSLRNEFYNLLESKQYTPPVDMSEVYETYKPLEISVNVKMDNIENSKIYYEPNVLKLIFCIPKEYLEKLVMYIIHNEILNIETTKNVENFLKQTIDEFIDKGIIKHKDLRDYYVDYYKNIINKINSVETIIDFFKLFDPKFDKDLSQDVKLEKIKLIKSKIFMLLKMLGLDDYSNLNLVNSLSSGDIDKIKASIRKIIDLIGEIKNKNKPEKLIQYNKNDLKEELKNIIKTILQKFEKIYFNDVYLKHKDIVKELRKYITKSPEIMEKEDKPIILEPSLYQYKLNIFKELRESLKYFFNKMFNFDNIKNIIPAKYLNLVKSKLSDIQDYTDKLFTEIANYVVKELELGD